MSPNSPRAKADQAEAKILYALHRFGYLTASQVAALVYPQHAQAVTMARRTLRRMAEHNLALTQRGAHVYDEQHYALSVAGAREVYQRFGIEAHSGKDALRIVTPHRDAANWAAIHLMHERYKKVWTEREIQTGRAPFKSIGAKVPDFLGSDEQRHCVWGEVEASRRGGRDMQKLAAWLVHVAFPPVTNNRLITLDPPRNSLYLSDVRFVIAHSSAQTFPQRLARALMDHGQIEDPVSWADGRLQFQFDLTVNSEIQDGFE